MFNALKYTKNLEENGFERDQAEILVGMFMQMIEFNMVTKSEFDKSQSKIYQRFEKFEVEVNHRFEKVDERFDKLEQNIDYKINKLSLHLTIKLGVLLALSVGLLSTILAIKL